MQPTPDAAGTAPPADLSLPTRIWAVYTAPRVLFQSLKERPRILGALVVLLLLGVVSAVLLSGPAMEAQMEAMRANPDMTEAQMQTAQQVAKTVGMAMFVFGSVLIALVLSAFLLLVANVFLGGRTTYRQMLSAVLHIGLIYIPALIVKAPLVLARNDINVQTSLAAFLPSSDQKTFLYQILAQTDLFTLWMWGLCILAVSVLAGVPVRRAGFAVGGIWLVLSVGAAALGTMGGS